MTDPKTPATELSAEPTLEEAEECYRQVRQDFRDAADDLKTARALALCSCVNGTCYTSRRLSVLVRRYEDALDAYARFIATDEELADLETDVDQGPVHTSETTQ